MYYAPKERVRYSLVSAERLSSVFSLARFGACYVLKLRFSISRDVIHDYVS
jgi:hypothetical protein